MRRIAGLVVALATVLAIGGNSSAATLITNGSIQVATSSGWAGAVPPPEWVQYANGNCAGSMANGTQASIVNLSNKINTSVRVTITGVDVPASSVQVLLIGVKSCGADKWLEGTDRGTARQGVPGTFTVKEPYLVVLGMYDGLNVGLRYKLEQCPC